MSHTLQIHQRCGQAVAALYSPTPVITDVGSALDLLMTIRQESDCSRVAINKEAICSDFFVLRTCLAGEILQKFQNYGLKFACYGDFTAYTSKPLQDFIRESNRGRDFFFVATEDEAIEKLSHA